jgi:ribosome-associated translation inhibitor RaiA
MTIVIDGIGHDPEFRSLVETKLEDTVASHGVTPLFARVSFVDENGPNKGGPAFRCTIVLDVPRWPAIAVHDVAESTRLAFDQALAALVEQVQRRAERARDRRRRPKKYFVAKRLLAVEGETPPGRYRSA